MIVYGHKNLKILAEMALHEIQINADYREIDSLWNIKFLENLFHAIQNEQKNKDGVIVLNPKFELFDKISFINFVQYGKSQYGNVFFAPQVNPTSFTNDPIYLYVVALDSVENFLIENLYRNNKIGLAFRNAMHHKIRGNSVSRVDIPKYLTNLHSEWDIYTNSRLSQLFLDRYLHVFFPAPITVHVALSNQCNLKCIMCPYHSKNYRTMHATNFFDEPCYMNIHEFENIAEYCGKNNIILQFGQLDEPLLHPHFSQFLDIAKKHGVASIAITTNGTLLNQKIAEHIASSNIKNITFSLDAIDRESYKKIRGHNYENTLDNINYLLELLHKKSKDTRIGACFILQGKNPEEKFKDFLHYWITKIDYVKCHQLTTFHINSQGILKPKQKETFRMQQGRYACSIPWQVLFILPNQKVTFCCTSMSQYATSQQAIGGGATIGDLSLSTLEQVWFGEPLKKLRGELMHNHFEEFKICEYCPNWTQGEPESYIEMLDGIKVKKTFIDYEVIYEREK